MSDCIIKFTPEAARLLSKMHPGNKKIIKDGLKELRQEPYSGADFQAELSGFKSYKVKRYRVLYKFLEDENTILIYYLGHRSDVYEQFQILLNSLA